MRAIILAITIFSTSSCFYKGGPFSKETEIKGIVIESLFPNFKFDSLKNEWAVESYDSQYTKVYYYKNQTLIQSNYGCARITGSLQGEYLKPEYKSCYYTYAFSDSFDQGVYFDSTDISSYKILKKDSMLANQWALNGNENNAIENTKQTLISSSVNSDGDLEEHYSTVNKKDSSMTGALLLTFSRDKLSGFNYSLAKEIEQKRKMKLVKIISINNARYMESAKTNIGRAEIPTQVREIKIDNADSLMQMFNQAKLMMQ